MNPEMLLKSMTPEVYQKLLQAVETGKWLDGNRLTEAQRETTMQAVMLYQAKVLKSEQHMTVGSSGEIVQKSRQQFKQELNDKNTIARFTENDI
ncbi:DUF1315 family protein [Paraglaciecola chathamensis]|jgi:uncharacterized protein YeaC (DUF1315 family)|uniref:DUF1315 family protein n=1 Tax=Paraglaciecola chathamensis TaxID=368405 RepID=A0ABS0WCE0_9ALTE|nr:DUF1315 family protein [Paraglaciecola chathamensis]MBJ2136154.1 DUF1315 family protein [Paraglaciecola chathamensis]|tara:strand:- start:1474 stop:1755 length:282 start_codon:yes stop_codon:yes gene_type:complete